MKIKYYVYREQATGDGDTGGGTATAEAATTTATATTDATATKTVDTATATTTTAPASKEAATTSTETKTETKGYWPDDWRNNIAKGDEKLLGRLGRYQSPEAMAQALIAAQNKISSGELKTPLSKNPTADELKAYRTEHGIPEAPDKYDLDIGGRKIADEDKPFIDQFVKNAHDTHQTPDQVKASLRAYYDIQDKITEQIQQRDAQAKDRAEDELRTEWGGEFKRNINLVSGLLDGVGSSELKDKLLRGRLSDGTPIGASAEAMRMLVSLALINNPAGTVVPNAGGNLDQAVDDEISKIENLMKTNRSAYNKDEKVQARYRELLGAREKLKERK